MTKPRRSFADEFKREAVALLEASGRPLMQIANELGIAPSMLGNWRNAAGVPAGASSLPKKQAMPASGAGGNPNDRICGCLHARLGDRIEPDVADTVKNDCFHVRSFRASDGM